MRKGFLFLLLTFIVSGIAQAQTKGTRVGYIDMEYILQNVPDYTEAQNLLEQKAQKWKQEIEAKKNEINKLKEALKAEKALLTKGLIEERISEITFLENEVLEYQQKKFGPDGELMKQKADLTKPIQDQVFTAVQDIAEAKKYDFIFDKTSDFTMLFAAKRFDISDQIIRVLNRTQKREQLTKKQLKEEAAKEAKEDALDENPTLQERQKALDEKKAAREKIIADRKIQQEERKLQIQAEKDSKKAGITSPTNTSGTTTEQEVPKTAAEEAKQKQADERAAALEARKKTIEDNKKAQEEKRKQVLAEREAKKTGTVSETTTAKEEKKSSNNETEKTVKEDTKITEEEAKQKQADARAKTIEERNKLIEERKKALEEKKKKILEEREAAAKKAQEEKLKTTN